MKRTSTPRGNWFTDMIRDNFWMLFALSYSNHKNQDVAEAQSPDDYLFSETPTGNIDTDYLDGLYSTVNEIEDDFDELLDDYDHHHDMHDDPDFGFDDMLDSDL